MTKLHENFLSLLGEFPLEPVFFKQDSGYGADIGANMGGTFFSGAYFPQKWADLSPFWSRFKLFQKHVSSYLTKEAKVALYRTHLHWCSHRLFHNCPKPVVRQLGIEPGTCKS
jgi:hypothetical protein